MCNTQPIYVPKLTYSCVLSTDHLYAALKQTMFMCLFLSSDHSAVSGTETSIREQPGHAEEAWCQTHPEARPHLPEATFGRLEVSLLTSNYIQG